MQSRGLDFLKPIWEMIYTGHLIRKSNFDPALNGLNLSENDVEVTYRRYINTMNPPENMRQNDKSIEEAVEAGITPGKKAKKKSKLKIN